MSKFQELLTMSRYQPEPVKLLMLFTKANVESASNDVNKGFIEPVMCVDKLPNELSDYEALCKEADVINPDWDLVFLTSINADVDSSIIDKSMKSMVSDVQTGKNTSMYVVLDRQDNLVELVGS
ncbi:ribonucleotide reductase subunit alpha [Pseudoalteromonas rubra]|uniref:Ribonucleotide reductase subunit alpha n=1 Tax=Pseudoalteromonas rubra TaxID=43658 RepID=A0A5S3WMB3_9GAMM|nr:ribonucleotide reductase subunit alpha [Pseudoalteromonas rubra]TMP29085.1 ribonucleotide reductase subunit alpha [Pseudoalteromonas rubra]TMP33550.1 ribonucleotide reductase subunit alpha [Pseudoalteromonas rubra]